MAQKSPEWGLLHCPQYFPEMDPVKDVRAYQSPYSRLALGSTWMGDTHEETNILPDRQERRAATVSESPYR